MALPTLNFQNAGHGLNLQDLRYRFKKKMTLAALGIAENEVPTFDSLPAVKSVRKLKRSGCTSVRKNIQRFKLNAS